MTRGAARTLRLLRPTDVNALAPKITVRRNAYDGAWVVRRGGKWVTWQLTWRDAYDAAYELATEIRHQLYREVRDERFPQIKEGTTK